MAKPIPIDKTVRRVEKDVSENQAAQRAIRSLAIKGTLSDIEKMQSTTLQGLKSRQYPDPYRGTIAALQSQIRDVETPDHVRAAMQEIVDFMSGPGETTEGS